MVWLTSWALWLLLKVKLTVSVDLIVSTMGVYMVPLALIVSAAFESAKPAASVIEKSRNFFIGVSVVLKYDIGV